MKRLLLALAGVGLIIGLTSACESGCPEGESLEFSHFLPIYNSSTKTTVMTPQYMCR